MLARFWGLHPKTLYLWVRTGRLHAVRTPGGQYRVDPDAVRSLAREHALPMPPFVSLTDRRIIVVESARAVLSSLRRECRGLAVSIEAYDDPYEAMVAAAIAPPAVLVVGPRADGFDPIRAVRALRKLQAGDRIAIVAYGLSGAADERAARRAGVTRVVRGGPERSVATEVATLLRRRQADAAGERARPFGG
jgi:PleD family two-component response regulator